MPVALILAFAASLGIHVAALFGPELDLASEPEPLPLEAELKPLPKPLPRLPRSIEKAQGAAHKTHATPSATPVLSVPASGSEPMTQRIPADGGVPSGSTSGVADDMGNAPLRAGSPLPDHGWITYRVDRGDSNFEIGVSRHTWEIVDGRYRLTSVSETTGLVWLFKAYRVEMVSQGRVTAEGLRPDSFSIRRNGQASRERAVFDWDRQVVLVGGREEPMVLPGAQDLLSFNYQLGFLAHPEAGNSLPIATGRKYGVYRLQVLGDEEIEIPAGTLRTLHLRTPGADSTELWLAYDYLMLPVKIRYVDRDGSSFVQVATQIQLGSESPANQESPP